MDTERAKRKAQLIVAFNLMRITYGERSQPQPTEELTPAQHHYLRYEAHNRDYSITRYCQGCGMQVDHYGNLDEKPHDCQLCRMFQGYPRRG